MKLPLVFRVFFYIIIPAWLLGWLCMRMVNPQPRFTGTTQEITYWQERGNFYKAADVALLDVYKHPTDFKRHAQFLTAYTLLELRERTLLNGTLQKTIGDVNAYYEKCKRSTSKIMRDVGIYGTTLLAFEIKHNTSKQQLLNDLGQMHNQQRPYVNELCYNICELTYAPDSNLMYLEREIAVNQKNEYAWTQLLLELSYQKDNRNELKSKLEQANAADIHIDAEKKRWLGLCISPMLYIRALYEPLFYTHSVIEILVALLVFLAWFIFLLAMNVFKDINLRVLAVVFFLALVLGPFTLMLYDGMYYLLLTMEIYIWRSLQEDILVTGLIEEFMKLLPVVLVLLFAPRKAINPFTLLLMGAISALVFAFEENILYFGHYYDVTITSRRAVLAVAMHVFTGSLTAYGFVLVKFNGKKWYWVPLCFVLAMCIHGTYNFLLSQHLWWLATLLTICGMFALGSFISNCLNQSERFDESKKSALKTKSIWIICSLSLIILIEFIITAFTYGLAEGEKTLGQSLAYNVWIILVVGLSFTRIELEKDKWEFIDFYGFHNLSLFGPSGGKKIVGVFNSANAVFSSGQTLEATVIKKIKSAGGDNWYLVTTTSEKMPHALIKFKEEGENFYDFNVYVHVRAVAGEEPVARFELKHYPFIGFMMISPVLEKKLANDVKN
ncbi:MAG TPA: PrsW family glutamic-type intramembrane protease [Flavobacteriales bacterium]|nr:PrsW family glutamic-type intramembrane protease [Flavobacteriales bacterium]